MHDDAQAAVPKYVDGCGGADRNFFGLIRRDGVWRITSSEFTAV